MADDGVALQRIFAELADLRDAVAASREDIAVVTAVLRRVEGSLERIDPRFDRFSLRLRLLEEGNTHISGDGA